LESSFLDLGAQKDLDTNQAHFAGTSQPDENKDGRLVPGVGVEPLTPLKKRKLLVLRLGKQFANHAEFSRLSPLF